MVSGGFEARPKATPDEFAKAAALYPPGSVVEATVSEVRPYGLFLDLPDAPLVGFLVYPNVDPAGAPVRPESDAVPALGQRLWAVVRAVDHERRQLSLSCRLSDFSDPA